MAWRKGIIAALAVAPIADAAAARDAGWAVSVSAHLWAAGGSSTIEAGFGALEGLDSSPDMLGFTPEKLRGDSSDQRNGVVAVSPAPSPSAAHATVSRRDLAEFVPGSDPIDAGNAEISDLSAVLDRSPLVSTAALGDAFDDPQEQAHLTVIGAQ